jgi:hypothetical protein
MYANPTSHYLDAEEERSINRIQSYLLGGSLSSAQQQQLFMYDWSYAQIKEDIGESDTTPGQTPMHLNQSPLPSKLSHINDGELP